jgi:hypothetical protein
MGVTERMTRLDQRAEDRFGHIFQRNYDTEPPRWLKYGGFALIPLGPMSLPLTFATSSRLTSAVLGVLLLVYVVVVLTWVRKHRL